MGHETDPKPDIALGKYRHSKSGKEYELVGLARHSETLEWLVVYKPLYENELSDLWVRPAAMWSEEVEFNGQKVKRFHFVGGPG